MILCSCSTKSIRRKWILVTHLFILVGRDSDELSFFEGNVGNQSMARANAHDVELRLVFMERVQHNLGERRQLFLFFHAQQ